jgi:hypothetical protein
MEYPPNPDQKEIKLRDFAVYAKPRSKAHTGRWILCEVLAWGGLLIGIPGVYFASNLRDSSPQLAQLIAQFSILLVPLFPVLRRTGKRLHVDAQNIIRSDNRAPILYLRPFSHDREATSYGILRRPTEMILKSALKNVGPLVAVAKPAEELPPLGAARLHFKGSEWQDRVAELMSISRLVIIETGRVSLDVDITYEDYPQGLSWEMSKATSCVGPGKLLVSFFFAQILDSHSRKNEFDAFKFLAGNTWGLQIPDLPNNCYFITFPENFTAEVVSQPKWKQLLYGGRTIAGLRETLRPVLSNGDIDLSRLRSYLTGAARLAYLSCLCYLVSYSRNPIFMCVLLALLYGGYRLFLHNLEGEGVIARTNRLVMWHLLGTE